MMKSLATMEQKEKKTLDPRQIGNLIAKHRRTILRISDFDLNDYSEYLKHSNLIKSFGDNYMAREFRSFVADEYNRDVIRFLIYYFNDCKKAEEIFPGMEYKLHKNLLLIGNPGTGKSIIMQIFSDYLKLTGNPNGFVNTSVTEMMNDYKIHGHIDRFTYNEGKALEGNPYNVCLNDIGLETENQKSYGTSLNTVIDEFLYARYEIYQLHGKKCHLTSNLSVEDFKTRFEGRLVDRFKSFNVLPLLGESRRR